MMARDNVAFVIFAGLLAVIATGMVWIIAHQPAPQPVAAAPAAPACDITALKTDLDAIKSRIDGIERVQARLVAATSGAR
jgi:hypothetical protein